MFHAAAVMAGGRCHSDTFRTDSPHATDSRSTADAQGLRASATASVCHSRLGQPAPHSRFKGVKSGRGRTARHASIFLTRSLSRSVQISDASIANNCQRDRVRPDAIAVCKLANDKQTAVRWAHAYRRASFGAGSARQRSRGHDADGSTPLPHGRVSSAPHNNQFERCIGKQ